MATKLIDIGAEGRQRIDRYELVGEIASGGMATVFLSRLSGVGGFQRFVAIKRLHPHLANEKEFVEMFLDEARLAAGIHHPNVVPILEVGASERGYYLVMEYIEGDTLARLLARAATGGKALPVPIGVRAVVDMLAGLHAAHELRDAQGEPTGLVHRDVSPQNVLVGSDGISRITDFGVARAATRLTATRVGQLKGKVAYMAPEQATGQEDVDRRADVFAAGIVLWEVLASRRLFKAANEAATLTRVISGAIGSPREHNPQLSSAVEAVCLRALERDLDRRWATAAEFADALERAAAQSGELATSREVANYVRDVLGDEIEQQREAVRSWLAQSEVSRIADPSLNASTVSAVAFGRDGLTGTVVDGRRRRPLWPWLAAAVVALLGTGAALLWPRGEAALPGAAAQGSSTASSRALPSGAPNGEAAVGLSSAAVVASTGTAAPALPSASTPLAPSTAPLPGARVLVPRRSPEKTPEKPPTVEKTPEKPPTVEKPQPKGPDLSNPYK